MLDYLIDKPNPERTIILKGDNIKVYLEEKCCEFVYCVDIAKSSFWRGRHFMLCN